MILYSSEDAVCKVGHGLPNRSLSTYEPKALEDKQALKRFAYNEVVDILRKWNFKNLVIESPVVTV